MSDLGSLEGTEQKEVVSCRCNSSSAADYATTSIAAVVLLPRLLNLGVLHSSSCIVIVVLEVKNMYNVIEDGKSEPCGVARLIPLGIYGNRRGKCLWGRSVQYVIK